MKNQKFYDISRFLTCFTLVLFCLTIVSCGDEDEEPVVEPVVEEPEPTAPTFDGKYSGGWWSNAANGSTYNNIPASITIAAGSSDTEWVGEFFYTASHISCCSATNPNDGSISFTMINSVITNFQYIGNLPNCAGSFQGEGVLNDDGTIVIQLTGSDCEGEHTGARIEMSK